MSIYTPSGAAFTSSNTQHAEAVVRNDTSRGHLLAAALRMQAERQRRLKYFRKDFFNEPAWSLLLCLYIQEFTREKITLTELSRRSNVSMTTSLRWLDTLDKERLVRRETNPRDKRIVDVELTEEARDKLDQYFS
jgi:DNA-binding MarR family transcriptional regulator